MKCLSFKSGAVLVAWSWTIAFAAKAGFVPITLTSGSYNQDVVVENTAPAPVLPGGYTTASMDNGLGNTGTSWYEQGYDSAAPNTGLPPAGSTFTSQSSSSHSYTMAPSYKANNAILLDSTLTNATLTLVTPRACSQLSFLESGGNNGVSFSYTVHHQNGATDTGGANIPDWYNGSNPAWTANGRVDVGTFGLSSVNGNDPRLYSLDFSLANTNSPVTSISFDYISGGGHGAIMAVSGASNGTFAPLAVTGYNEDIVVEAGAGVPGSLSGFTTATMDTGLTNTLNTWYEEGYDPDAPETGLPPAGSTITNVSAPDHLYKLAPSYAADNVLLLTSNAPTGTLTLATPATEHGLSFLCAAGNGPVTVSYVIHHNNDETENGSMVVEDWFSYSPVAFFANGRVDVSAKTVNNVNASNPCLYAVDIPVQITSSPVASVTLTWASGGGDGNVAIFALSGGSSSLPLAGDDFNTNSAVAASVLQQWYNESGLYNSTGWWNAANCMEALELVAPADNQLQYLGVLSNTFNLNSGGDFLDEYYDDNGWWANAWIRAFDLTGNTNFLVMAKTIFTNLLTGWDSTNTVCPGGIWWNTSRNYKNAIPNELFLLAAIRLHQRTPGDGGEGSFFYWATNEWAWFKASGMINSDNLINDGLNGCVNNGETTWTYNQGVILGGLTDLYKVTGDTAYLTQAELIANAAVTTLVNSKGVLVEPCEPNCGGDGPQFKGIFVRYLAYLYDVTRTPAYYGFLYTNAHSIWLNDRNVFNQLGLMWDGTWDSDDAARQSSALTEIASIAEPITTNLILVKGSGDPAFSHAIGSATGSLAWTCGPTNTSSANYMQSGPRVSYLPTGLHAAHFQFSVDALSNSAASLGTVVVFEDDGGTVLAKGPIPWSAFVETNRPQDFVLLFTNSVAADPLEFRIFWNNLAGAPDLTATDVAIDGLLNWSAANLTHDIGKFDGVNAWEADLRSASASGYLTRGPTTLTIPPGDYTAVFELKVDNFNWDNAAVAMISVVDVDSDLLVASENLTRHQFSSVLYHAFALNFTAVPGVHYDFRTYWYRGATAPRLTQRSVILRPGPVAFFTSVQADNGAPQFTFTGVPGRTYTLEATTSLSSGAWSTIGSFAIPLNLGFTQASDSAPGTARFYRLSYP